MTESMLAKIDLDDPENRLLMRRFDEAQATAKADREDWERKSAASTAAANRMVQSEELAEGLLQAVAAAMGIEAMGRTSYSWRVREALGEYRESPLLHSGKAASS